MFSPIKNTKVYELVIEQIKEMISNGTLKKGDKLPSERELVEELQVSRTSIREALRSLEIVGLIESRQGEGNFIKDSFKNNFFQPLSIMFLLQNNDITEVLELRRIIEIENCELAAQRITNEELDILKELIYNFKNCESEDESIKVDKKFHYMIAQSSHNNLVLCVLNSISTLMDSIIKDAREKILKEGSNKEILIQQHENIYNALYNHDSKKAAICMKQHLDFAYSYFI